MGWTWVDVLTKSGHIVKQRVWDAAARVGSAFLGNVENRAVQWGAALGTYTVDQWGNAVLDAIQPSPAVQRRLPHLRPTNTYVPSAPTKVQPLLIEGPAAGVQTAIPESEALPVFGPAPIYGPRMASKSAQGVGGGKTTIRIGRGLDGAIRKFGAAQRRARKQAINSRADFEQPHKVRDWSSGVLSNIDLTGTEPDIEGYGTGRCGWLADAVNTASWLSQLYKLIFSFDGGTPQDIYNHFGLLWYTAYQKTFKNPSNFPANLDIFVCYPKDDIAPVSGISLTNAGLMGDNPVFLTQSFAASYSAGYIDEDAISARDYRNQPGENPFFKELFNIKHVKRARLNPGEVLVVNSGRGFKHIEPMEDGIQQVTTTMSVATNWAWRKWWGPMILYKIWGDISFEEDTHGYPSETKVNMGQAQLAYVTTRSSAFNRGGWMLDKVNYEVNINVEADPVSEDQIERDSEKQAMRASEVTASMGT